MKISPINNLNFKGYDAAPLKRLHANGFQTQYIDWELDDIMDRENIKINDDMDFAPWIQDHITFIKDGNKTRAVASKSADAIYLNDLKNLFSINSKRYTSHIAGGNMFIGKYENGENWAIVGNKEINSEKDIEKFAKLYSVKEENITAIPQMNFHIDMFLRPIGYPNVLVNDPNIVKDNIENLKGAKGKKQSLQKSFETYENLLYGDYKTKYEDVIKALKDKGFNPIPIGGVYNRAINFMNAVVNKHKDGTISYITNSSDTKDNFITQIQEGFKKEIKQKAKNLDRIYFVAGCNMGERSNYMMTQLANYCGGIHCMLAEEPDFEAWG